MSLKEKLDAIREGAAKMIPPAAFATMQRATEDLRRSGILDGVIKVGDRLPAFALANARGQRVASADLLAQGPLVLSIFRGHW